MFTVSVCMPRVFTMVKKRLSYAKTCILKVFRSMLQQSCLQPLTELGSVSVEHTHFILLYIFYPHSQKCDNLCKIVTCCNHLEVIKLFSIALSQNKQKKKMCQRYYVFNKSNMFNFSRLVHIFAVECAQVRCVR